MAIIGLQATENVAKSLTLPLQPRGFAIEETQVPQDQHNWSNRA